MCQSYEILCQVKNDMLFARPQLAIILKMLGFFTKGIICPHLDDLQYGGVNVSSYYPDSRVHYYCNKGYKLVGDPYRVCLYDGTWNKKAPVCKSKYYL